MESKTFEWIARVQITKDDVREFLGLSEDDTETYLTNDDWYNCALDCLENEQCEYNYHGHS